MTQMGIALLADGRCNELTRALKTLPADVTAAGPPLALREYRVRLSPDQGWRELWQLRAQLVRDEVAAIHAASPGVATLTARWLSARTGLPMIASCYDGTTLERHRYASWLLSGCARVVVPSEWVRAGVIAAGWSRPDRLVLARAGVDTATFSPTRRSASLRETWRVSGRRPAIVCTAPLTPPELALLARIRSILDDYRRPHRFIVTGSRGDVGAWQKALPDAAFLDEGPAIDLGTVLASGDIFLSTARSTYPDPAVTLLAAQVSGLPLLVPGTGAHANAMLDGSTGHLCHADDEQDFAFRTAELLANAPRRTAMAAAAVAYALTCTWQSTSQGLLQAYHDVSRPTAGALPAGAAIPRRVRV